MWRLCLSLLKDAVMTTTLTAHEVAHPDEKIDVATVVRPAIEDMTIPGSDEDLTLGHPPLEGTIYVTKVVLLYDPPGATTTAAIIRMLVIARILVLFVEIPTVLAGHIMMLTLAEIASVDIEGVLIEEIDVPPAFPLCFCPFATFVNTTMFGAHGEILSDSQTTVE